MQDRIPVNPGRVLITPEGGSAAFYATMARADNPTQEGTPLNKASLLKDTTAVKFGLGVDAVPDDVLSLLSRFHNGLGNEYVWAKTKSETTQGFETETAYTNKIVYQASMPFRGNMYYAETYHLELRDDGYCYAVLNDPQYITVTDGNYAQVATYEPLLGHYSFLGNSTEGVGVLFFLPADATLTYGSHMTVSEAVGYSGRYIREETTLYGYVNSPDPAAYPIDDGYTYTALGQIGNKVQMATGSYTGTGDHGTAYKNTLTFDFVPKAVIVHGYVYGGHGSVTMLYGSTYLKDSIYTNYNSVDLTISWSEKTVSWYGTSAENQMNYSGQKYQYLAIG